jgi:hypothetical protein
VSRKLETEIAQVRGVRRKGVTVRNEASWDWISQLSAEDGQRAALALRNLAFGGEFADWIRKQRIPAPANLELEEAIDLVSEFVRKYPPPPAGRR